ncbi:hypothetical protein LCGC14_0304850, partial [marine sediment metagenome]
MTADDHPRADPSPPAGDILADVAKATSLREGREGVATILRIVANDGPLALRDLARLVRMPLPVVSAIRRELETTDSEYDREKLQERLAKLAGGVAHIM